MATSSHSPKQEKACWDETNVAYFLSILVEEIDAGSRPAGHFTKIAWTNITRKFFDASGCNFTQAQLKNKWYNMKKEFRLWEKLLHEETGLGYDHATGRITADPHWWRQKIKEKSEYHKFKTHGPIHLSLQEKVFRGIVTTGEMEYHPSTVGLNEKRPFQFQFHSPVGGDTGDPPLSGDSPKIQTTADRVPPNVETTFSGTSGTKEPPKQKRTRTPGTRPNTTLIPREEMAHFLNVMQRTEETAESAVQVETAESAVQVETGGKGSYEEAISLCLKLPWMDDEILIIAMAVLEDNTKRIAFRMIVDKGEDFIRRWIHVQARLMDLSQKLKG